MEKIQDKDVYKVFKLFKEKKFKEAEDLIKQGIVRAQRQRDAALEGLFESTYGMFHKLQKDYKKAYKHYERAEKLIPTDPTLKLITTELLIDQFKQYDTALRKLDKLIQENKDSPTILHRATAMQGIGYFLLQKKDKAKVCLGLLVNQDFKSLRFATNLDFKLVEHFVKKRFALDLCQSYLKKALELAKSTKELGYINTIQQLLAGVAGMKP